MNTQGRFKRGSLTYPNPDQDANPSQEPPAFSTSPNEDLKDMDILCNFKIKIAIQKLEYGCIKDQWPYANQDQDENPSQEPSAPIKSLNHDLKDMDLLYTFKIKIESQISSMDVSNTSDYIQIEIKMPNPSLEPPASSKAPN